ncbi:hypothetical protein RRG08_023873 [Elysia crispata]|uniref:Uncharacterized protein n=1 Tax=Elysia crispata TaxID=231223 RepID=A0AAE1AUC6_9GAST|nr:hypothetical protein RRG08_023873 [Elysia crispata]
MYDTFKVFFTRNNLGRDISEQTPVYPWAMAEYLGSLTWTEPEEATMTSQMSSDIQFCTQQSLKNMLFLVFPPYSETTILDLSTA